MKLLEYRKKYRLSLRATVALFEERGAPVTLPMLQRAENGETVLSLTGAARIVVGSAGEITFEDLLPALERSVRSRLVRLKRDAAA
jgi:hypothetical protein